MTPSYPEPQGLMLVQMLQKSLVLVEVSVLQAHPVPQALGQE